MRLRHLFCTAVTLVALGGCSKSCSWFQETRDESLGPEGVPTPMATLPGHKVEGTLDIHPYDGGLPYLYGPFYFKRPAKRQVRVINKIGQPINDARLTVVADPEQGDAQPEACKAVFLQEGVYEITCVYDRIGGWDLEVEAVSGADKGRLEYKTFVRPASAEPIPTPTP